MTPEANVIQRCFRIVNKQQEDVDFILNTAQSGLDSVWSPRMIIPKSRRQGISRYFLARSTVRCLGVRNTSAVVISHEAEATERMLMAVRYFLEHFKGPKPLIRNMSKNEITFPKTNSMFYIGTAGSRAFGRGDTITDLHCSEVPHWPDAKKLMTGLLQAVPKGAHGRISIESTGNGMGDWFHNACMRAAKGQSSFKLHFLPWHTFPEYTIGLSEDEEHEVMSTLREDIGEPDLVITHGITAGQLAWRRIVLEDELDGDVYMWNQEYPTVLADCFQSSGAGFFQKVNYVPTSDWVRFDQHLTILRGHPRKDYHYVLGGDVGAGVGQNSSVGEVFCVENGEQVAEWLSNRIEPDVFADHLAKTGRIFNEAGMCVESNNHGLLTLACLRGIGGLPPLYPMYKVYRTPRAGSSRSPKDQKMRREWTIHSPILNAELSTFIEHEDGTLGAADGCHDDTVIAAAMACFVFDKAAVSLVDAPVPSAGTEDDPFSLQSMLASIDRKSQSNNNLPFPPYIMGVDEPMDWEGIEGANLPS